MDLALFTDVGTGQYELEVDPRPGSGARPEDFPYLSADLVPTAPVTAARSLSLSDTEFGTLHRFLAQADGRVLYVYVYRPQDLEEMLSFDAAIMDRYNEYFNNFGIAYAGTFVVHGLGDGVLGEVVSIDATTLTAAKALVYTEAPEPPDIEDIIQRCVALQRRDEPRYTFWLTPR